MVAGFTTLCPSRTVVTSFTPRRRVSDASHNTTTSIPNNDNNMNNDNGNNNSNNNNNNNTNTYEQGDWVWSIARTDQTVCCALSNEQVQVYDQQRLHLCTGYAHPAVDLQSDGISTLVSAGRDGTVAVFDIRQKQVAMKMGTTAAATHHHQTHTHGHAAAALESVSLGFNGTLVAAGSAKGKIHFFDLRQSDVAGKFLLGTYGDSHTDAVSQVQFASPTSSVLLSGGEDGLVCCFDTSQPTEELAVKSCLNIGTPLRRVGFCGDAITPEGVPTTVYCLTGSETACLWDWGSGGCLQNFGGFELRKHLTHTLAAAAVSTANQPRRQAPSFSVDYLIDAHWDTPSRSLVMAVGSVSGEAALMRLSSDNPDVWQPCHFLRGGHRGVVRAWCPLSSPTSPAQISVSAGEDARLVEWNHHYPSLSSSNEALRRPSLENTNAATMATSCGTDAMMHNGFGPSAATTTATGVRAGGPLRRQMKRHKASASPY